MPMPHILWAAGGIMFTTCPSVCACVRMCVPWRRYSLTNLPSTSIFFCYFHKNELSCFERLQHTDYAGVNLTGSRPCHAARILIKQVIIRREGEVITSLPPATGFHLVYCHSGRNVTISPGIQRTSSCQRLYCITPAWVGMG